MFQIGALYNRRKDIHDKYGGQRQGGISTPKEHPFVFLFTGDEGHAYGYKDGWNEEGVFLYTGEGQKGDQQLTRGNKAISSHLEEGKELFLFKKVETGIYQFISRMNCIGYSEELRPDGQKDERKVLVFDLIPAESNALGVIPKSEETELSPVISNLSLEELREKALQNSSRASSSKERKKLYRQRAEYVRLYALKVAKGICGGCGNEAPFKTKTGEPYLEVHHLQRLSDGGADHPDWVIALCPTCHRRIHHGEDGESFNEELKKKRRNA